MDGRLTATVRHHFSAGHRIVGLPGAGAKCSNVHGHTFGVNWTVALPGLDAQQVEFGAIKRAYRGWVDEHLDHGFIAHADDHQVVDWLKALGSKHYVLGTPPTTEAIASLIAHYSQSALPGVSLLSVEVTEGPHNAATWHADHRGKTWVEHQLAAGTITVDEARRIQRGESL
ncbi:MULTISPECIES: 6-pyruvoyl trahydropterin synthase family protein [Mycolicibacterium]|nr:MULTISPECIES: 6-carboxytetrahydropterin synthase [Mycolicibacterium]MCC9181092.1 6-carboxytetrahydropterin synthase [Mycolicibacterium mageritense]UBV14809.1 6-carboxytetrahydropterin synthase [Mycolicibacterium fortuitum]